MPSGVKAAPSPSRQLKAPYWAALCKACNASITPAATGGGVGSLSTQPRLRLIRASSGMAEGPTCALDQSPPCTVSPRLHSGWKTQGFFPGAREVLMTD